MSQPPGDDVWRRWTPAAQEKALAALRDAVASKWKPFYCTRENCDGHPHDGWDFKHARSKQHPPKGDWLTWLVLGGRGAGKTRTGTEWCHRRTKVSPRIALIAPTGPDGRDVMVEGESGILAMAHPENRPMWEPSKRRLTWPNGAMGFVYSGEEPDRLRGPQHYDVWIDEPAHMPLIEEVWSIMLLGLRLGEHPRICATTTPKPTTWMRGLIKEDTTVTVVTSTYENIDNLAPSFAEHVLSAYEGTRRGRQEIHGEVLLDTEGSLWDWDMIEDHRIAERDVPAMDRVVVGIDPAGSAHAKSDETGIVVVGVSDGEFYVLADHSGRFTPTRWAARSVVALNEFGGDALVVERNYGGDMVRTTLEAADEQARIIEVTSRRGKVIRADPIVALYERGRVHHVGYHKELEDQLTGWVPGTSSPDRLDALVHGLTNLAKVVTPASIATPSQLRHLRVVRDAG